MRLSELTAIVAASLQRARRTGITEDAAIADLIARDILKGVAEERASGQVEHRRNEPEV
jgi:hypothetical protein